MKILFYSAKEFEKPYLEAANKGEHELVYLPVALSLSTASRAWGFEVVSIFVTDAAPARVLEKLFRSGVKILVIRAAGYDNVDLTKADSLGIVITHVPKYSSYAVAEHAVALLLALNRKIVLADHQVHKQNFTTDSLVGFDLHGKTIGVIGVGKIGSIFCKIMHGFGCRLLAYDVKPNKTLKKQYGVSFVSLEELCQHSDIISIHTPLTDQTKYLLENRLIKMMKNGVMLINTGRGLCVSTSDVLEGLRIHKIGSFGADVYEGEKGIFFIDHSHSHINDKVLKKLLGLNNVIITPHQAFATQEALQAIARSVFSSIRCWSDKKRIPEQLTHIYPMADPATYVDAEEA